MIFTPPLGRRIPDGCKGDSKFRAPATAGDDVDTADKLEKLVEHLIHEQPWSIAQIATEFGMHPSIHVFVDEFAPRVRHSYLHCECADRRPPGGLWGFEFEDRTHGAGKVSRSQPQK